MGKEAMMIEPLTPDRRHHALKTAAKALELYLGDDTAGVFKLIATSDPGPWFLYSLVELAGTIAKVSGLADRPDFHEALQLIILEPANPFDSK